MRTPTLAARVQLPLGWNTNLLFNTDAGNFEWKTDEGETESICFVNFCSLPEFQLSDDEEWWGGVESLI